ncbi:hypothetical protein DY252_20665 [Thalassospira indica]|uniref:Uncharacterized protein n=1 Tax=Thalassospira indica TaxID=1891279 RepID=A0ABN5NL06_9PROT|nr:hypothetical protein DY252_20665 [Thalassospira indica]
MTGIIDKQIADIKGNRWPILPREDVQHHFHDGCGPPGCDHFTVFDKAIGQYGDIGELFTELIKFLPMDGCRFARQHIARRQQPCGGIDTDHGVGMLRSILQSCAGTRR